MRRLVLTLTLLAMVPPAAAQFVGPDEPGQSFTAAEIRDVRLGRYVTMTGHIVSHLRGDYYLFRDETGEIRVEISSRVWQGREVRPETRVRLLGEVDRGVAGRYVWVKSLDVLS